MQLQKQKEKKEVFEESKSKKGKGELQKEKEKILENSQMTQKNKQERQSLSPISLGNWPDISCFHKIQLNFK